VYFQFDAIKNVKAKIGLILKAPNGETLSPNNPFFFYNKSNFFLDPDPKNIIRCYAAISIPAEASKISNVVGNWQARLDGGDGAIVPQRDIEVRICQRVWNGKFTREAYTQSGSCIASVPVKVFYVGKKWRGDLLTLWPRPSYHLKAFYKTAGICLEGLELGDIHFVEAPNITSNLYDTATQNLIEKNAEASAINLFLVEDLPIAVDGALGFSPIMGPQGFKSPYSFVFIKIQEKQFKDPQPRELARIIGHEIGHYLGLTHESSSERQTNLMYPRNTFEGIQLNEEQKFMLLSAPITSITLPKEVKSHLISKLRIKIKTGKSVYSWWNLDGAGTDDEIYFAIGSRSNNLKSQKVSSDRNDFEANQDWWYTLDPMNLNIEDIEIFEISKSSLAGIERMSLLGSEDAWLLDRLVIEINNIEVFNQQNINQWLTNDGSGQSSWSKPIPKENLSLLLKA
jgi:hypothetical protein